MGKILLAADTCVQNDVDIDKKLLTIIQKEVDYTICNLEGFIMSSGDLSETLASSPKYLAKFAEAMKIKAVSLANNHINDGKKVGRQETIRTLIAMGIEYFGTKSRPAFTAKRTTGELVSVLGSVWKLSGGNLSNLNQFWFSLDEQINLLNELKKNSDILIWFPHWGIDMECLPHPWQFGVAETMIDKTNIDVIYGHHSHLVHPNSIIEKKAVVFCGGTFVMPKNKITYYLPSKTGKGRHLLLEPSSRSFEVLETFYNRESKKLELIGRYPFKNDYLDIENYDEFFLHKRKKKKLPIYKKDNLLGNYVKSIYPIIMSRMLRIAIIRKIWKMYKEKKL